MLLESILKNTEPGGYFELSINEHRKSITPNPVEYFGQEVIDAGIDLHKDIIKATWQRSGATTKVTAFGNNVEDLILNLSQKG